jgi:hypothetical protein
MFMDGAFMDGALVGGAFMDGVFMGGALVGGAFMDGGKDPSMRTRIVHDRPRLNASRS